MTNSTAPDLLLKNLCFFPTTGITLCEQLTDCYRQFTESIVNNGFSIRCVIKQTIFISVAGNTEYAQIKQEVLACAKTYFDELPPTSIVAQSPESGTIVLEVVCLAGLQSGELSHRKNETASWLVFERGNMKMLIASCSGEVMEQANILQQSTSAFEQLQHILAEENMGFSDVMRQWNYIEKIIATDHNSNLTSQHYQVFNDVRSKYYQHANFGNGFPAATGIGMDYGGIVIDIIAVQNGNKGSVVAVKSPLQLDAYNYSQAVLAENNTMSDFCQTTPKFERAKILGTPANKWVFISGTAAIKGQVSIPELTAESQTEMTVQNILNLISIDNLKKHGINSGEKARMSNLRIYVKNRTDMPQVKAICDNYFPQIPAIYIVADICRPELLVEIEGQAII